MHSLTLLAACAVAIMLYTSARNSVPLLYYSESLLSGQGQAERLVRVYEIGVGKRATVLRSLDCQQVVYTPVSSV